MDSASSMISTHFEHMYDLFHFECGLGPCTQYNIRSPEPCLNLLLTAMSFHILIHFYPILFSFTEDQNCKCRQ